MGNKFTRRTFLTAASAGAAWIVLTNAPGCKQAEPSARATPSRTTSLAQPEPVLVQGSPLSPQQNAWTFRTHPDLNPPAVDVARQAHDATPSYIFAAPKSAGPGQNGPIIVDDHGQVVWFRHPQRKDALAMNFKVQHYRGEPVLTWWEGYYGSRGVDEYVILDSSYKEITRLQAGNGYLNGDHHEFLISPQDTALIAIYNLVHADLSLVGGPKDGVLWQGTVQELDIETGRVLFEWHSLDHVGVDESYPNQEENQFGQVLGTTAPVRL